MILKCNQQNHWGDPSVPTEWRPKYMEGQHTHILMVKVDLCILDREGRGSAVHLNLSLSLNLSPRAHARTHPAFPRCSFLAGVMLTFVCSLPCLAPDKLYLTNIFVYTYIYIYVLLYVYGVRLAILHNTRAPDAGAWPPPSPSSRAHGRRVEVERFVLVRAAKKNRRINICVPGEPAGCPKRLDLRGDDLPRFVHSSLEVMIPISVALVHFYVHVGLTT